VKKSILQVSLTRDELRFLTELADRCGCVSTVGWDAGKPSAKLLVKAIAAGEVGVSIPEKAEPLLPDWFKPCTRGQLAGMLFLHLGVMPAEVDGWIERNGLVMVGGRYCNAEIEHPGKQQ
jgi:hypothetical protein